jgi:aconitase B
MTPKEKAKELYSKMYGETSIRTVIAEIEKDKQCAKQCALNAVEEVMFVLNEIDSTEQWNATWFYYQVKKEIENL